MTNNIDNKFECPEGYKECAALEMFRSGCGITIEKTGKSYAILSNEQEYLGEVYCSNPDNCISKYARNFKFTVKKSVEVTPN